MCQWSVGSINKFNIFFQNELVASYVDDDTAKLPPECRFDARYVRIYMIESETPTDKENNLAVKFKLFGCPNDKDAPAETCTYAVEDTPDTTKADKWRHIALDETNSILYFCDYNPLKERMVCYSTSDGNTWNVLPSYIGSLRGWDSGTKKMYAYDTKKRATVASEDGKKWTLVHSTTSSSIETTVKAVTVVPGKPKRELTTALDIGNGWKGDFDGITKDGTIKVKWGTCCS